MIETNHFFLQKKGVNRIVLRYKIGTQSDWKSPKQGSSPRNLPTMPKYGCTPPPPGNTSHLIDELTYRGDMIWGTMWRWYAITTKHICVLWQKLTTAISALCWSDMRFCYQPAEGSQEIYQSARLFENFQSAGSLTSSAPPKSYVLYTRENADIF